MPFAKQLNLPAQAIFSDSGKLKLGKAPSTSFGPKDLLIKVKALGLCRTDLYAINGQIPTYSKRFVPGHEFTGVISETGSNVSNFQRNSPVVVNPVFVCGKCDECKTDRSHNCNSTEFMGVDFDGACTEYIVVPESQAYSFPQHLSFEEAAFSEPVAATLAIQKSNIGQNENGLILGDCRISELAIRVLKGIGFQNLTHVGVSQSQNLKSSTFDFVIDTELNNQSFETMCRLVRPRGTIVLKSRQFDSIQFVPRTLIPKEPTITFVNYSRFEEAIDLIASRKICVKDLIGHRYSLSQFNEAFEHASDYESKKVFLVNE